MRLFMAPFLLILVMGAVMAQVRSPAPPRRPRAATASHLAGNRVEITVRGDYRYISANGVPDHQPGRFPNRGNPNAIRPQRQEFRVPLHPEVADRITPVRGAPFGVALNGVVFFPGTAEWWNNDPSAGWNYEALSGRINLGLDGSNAHVQPTGMYHYHGLPTGLLAQLGGDDRMVLAGYAADGFPIYAQYCDDNPADPGNGVRLMRSGYRLKDGGRPGGPEGRYDGSFVQDWEYVDGSGDLDACNGHVGATLEYPGGRYHYHLTDGFPFVPRFLRGAPDESFVAQRLPGRRVRLLER